MTLSNQQFHKLNTNGGISRCQGITNAKARCKRDVTHQLGGVGYCERHFMKEVEKRIKPK